MDPQVKEYIDEIPEAQRRLFDRLQALILNLGHVRSTGWYVLMWTMRQVGLMLPGWRSAVSPPMSPAEPLPVLRWK